MATVLLGEALRRRLVDAETRVDGRALRAVLREAQQLVCAGRLHPSFLVLATEACLQMQEHDLAKETVEFFLSRKPTVDHFYCRALLCLAVLQKNSIRGLKGTELCQGMEEAIAFQMQVLDIWETNKSRYNFLVYNTSVRFWQLVSSCLRPGICRILVSPFQRIIAALQQTGFCEPPFLKWLAQNMLFLALCLEDAGKTEDASKSATSCIETITRAKASLDLEDAQVEEFEVLERRARRVQLHLLRANAANFNKARSDTAASTPGPVGRALGLVLGLRTGVLGDPKVYQAEVEALIGQLSMSAAEVAASSAASAPSKGGAGKKGGKSGGHAPSMSFGGGSSSAGGGKALLTDKENLRMDMLAEIGYLCANMGEIGFAEQIQQIVRSAKSVQAVVFNEYSKALCSIAQLGDQGEKLTQAVVAERVRIVRMVERALHSAARCEDFSVVEEGCLLVWNTALPLLQPNLRMSVQKALQTCSTLLEEHNSVLHRLRVQLYLELAKMDVAEDVLSKALISVNKALSLDYVCAREEQEKFRLARPLDRYLVPMKEALDLRTSLYRDPESPSERARLVIDQARDVADSLLRKTLLDRAIGYLEELCPAPVEGADQVAAPAGDDSIPMTTRLWLDVALLSWKDEGKVVSTLEASFPYCVQHRFDPIRFKELCIDQAQGCYNMAEAQLLKLREEFLDIGETDFEEDEEELRKFALDREDSLASYLLQGMEAGLHAQEDWLVTNGAILMWNYHMNLFSIHGPPSVCSRFVERFDACYNLLTRCQQRDIVVEQRISLALAMSLVQRHLVRFQARQQAGSDSEVPSWLLLSRNPSPTGDSLLEFQDAASEDLRRAQEVLERGIERSKSLSVKLHISLLAVVQKMRNQEPAPKPAADAWHKIIFRLQCLEMEQTVDVQTRHRYFAEALQALRTAPHLELGSRLAVQAFKLNLLHESLECADLVEKALPQDPLSSLHDRQWRWMSLVQRVRSQTIVALLSPDVPINTRTTIIRQVLSLLVQAAENGLRANVKSLITAAARCFLNVGSPLAQRAEQRGHIQPMLVSLLQCLGTVEIKDPEKLKRELAQPGGADGAGGGTGGSQMGADDSSQILVGEDGVPVMLPPPEEPTEVREMRELAELCVKLYLLLLRCLEDQQNWQGGLRWCKEAVRHLPNSFHKSIWEASVKFVGELGENASQIIGRLKGYDKETQVQACLELARSSAHPKDSVMAFGQALLAAGEDTVLRCSSLLEFGVWLHLHAASADVAEVLLSMDGDKTGLQGPAGREIGDTLAPAPPKDSPHDHQSLQRQQRPQTLLQRRATELLQAVVDEILELEEVFEPAADEGMTAGTRMTKGSSKSRSRAGMSQAGRSHMSRRSRQHRSRAGSVTGSQRTTSSGRPASSHAMTLLREPDPPIHAKHLELVIRALVMQALTAPSQVARQGCMHLALHSCRQFLSISVHLCIKKNAFDLAEDLSSVRCPDTLEDWLHFSVPDALLELFNKETCNGFCLSSKSVPKPQLLLRSVECLYELFVEDGLALYTLPVLELLRCLCVVLLPNAEFQKLLALRRCHSLLCLGQVTQFAEMYQALRPSLSLDAATKAAIEEESNTLVQDSGASTLSHRVSQGAGALGLTADVLNPMSDADCWSKQALLLSEFGEWSRAQDLATHSLLYSEAAGLCHSMGRCYRAKLRLALMEGKLEVANQFAQLACRQPGDVSTWVSIVQEMIGALLEREEYRQIREWLEDSYDKLDELCKRNASGFTCWRFVNAKALLELVQAHALMVEHQNCKHGNTPQGLLAEAEMIALSAFKQLELTGSVAERIRGGLTLSDVFLYSRSYAKTGKQRLRCSQRALAVLMRIQNLSSGAFAESLGACPMEHIPYTLQGDLQSALHARLGEAHLLVDRDLWLSREDLSHVSVTDMVPDGAHELVGEYMAREIAQEDEQLTKPTAMCDGQLAISFLSSSLNAITRSSEIVRASSLLGTAFLFQSVGPDVASLWSSSSHSDVLATDESGLHFLTAVDYLRKSVRLAWQLGDQKALQHVPATLEFLAHASRVVQLALLHPQVDTQESVVSSARQLLELAAPLGFQTAPPPPPGGPSSSKGGAGRRGSRNIPAATQSVDEGASGPSSPGSMEAAAACFVLWYQSAVFSRLLLDLQSRSLDALSRQRTALRHLDFLEQHLSEPLSRCLPSCHGALRHLEESSALLQLCDSVHNNVPSVWGVIPPAVTILSLTLGQSLLQEGQLFVTVAHPATGQLLSQLCTFDTKGWAEVMRSYQEFEDAYNSISGEDMSMETHSQRETDFIQLIRDWSGVFHGVCSAAHALLDPLLVQGEDSPSVSLIVDLELQPVPWELLVECLNTVPTARNFSIHMLCSQLRDLDPSLDGLQEVHFVCDPENEGSRQMGGESTLERGFAKLQEDGVAVMGRWKGLSGVQQIPSLGQWQQLMTSNSIFLYLGYSPLLSYLSPGEIAGIQLQGLKLAIMLDRSESSESLKRRLKADAEKRDREIEMEGPFYSAAFLMSQGCRNILMTVYPSTHEENLSFLRKMVEDSSQGFSLSEFVAHQRREAVEFLKKHVDWYQELFVVHEESDGEDGGASGGQLSSRDSDFSDGEDPEHMAPSPATGQDVNIPSLAVPDMPTDFGDFEATLPVMCKCARILVGVPTLVSGASLGAGKSGAGGKRGPKR